MLEYVPSYFKVVVHVRPRMSCRTCRYLAVKWIPPKWDWFDPLKDRKAEIEAIEAGLKSRSDVIESEGYDAE